MKCMRCTARGILVVVCATVFYQESSAGILSISASDGEKKVATAIVTKVFRGRYAMGERDFYLATGGSENGIPQKKLRAARIASAVPETDTVLALLDCTVWGSAKENLIFGEAGIYYRTSWTRTDGPRVAFIGYDSFSDRTFERIDWSEASFDFGQYFVVAGCSFSSRELVELLNEIRLGLAKEGQRKSRAQVAQYAAPREDSNISLLEMQIDPPDHKGNKQSQSTLQLPSATVIVAVIDAVRFQPRIVGVERDNPSGHSSLAALMRSDADLVIGSGFVEQFYPLKPLGLLVIDEVEVSPLAAKGFPSILVVQDNQLVFEPKEAYVAGDASGAIQTGPWLVQDGETAIEKGEPWAKPWATRSWVALCSNDIILAGITLDRVSLYSLADFISSPEKNGGHECHQAVNLAGGGSESLVLRGLDEEPTTFGNVSTRQGSLVIFEVRQQ